MRKQRLDPSLWVILATPFAPSGQVDHRLPLADTEGQHGIALAVRRVLMHRRGVIDHPARRPPALPMPEQLMPLLEHHLAVAPCHGGEA